MRTKLTEAEAELAQQKNSGDTEELKAELKRTQEELEENQKKGFEVWTRFTSLKKELEHHKESVTWLRGRVRTYKQRISDLEKGQASNLKEKQGATGGKGATATAQSAAAAPLMSPVVTRLSLRSRSPRNAQVCLTVMANRSPASSTFSTGVKAAASTRRAPSDCVPPFGGSATRTGAGIKRPLFPETG